MPDPKTPQPQHTVSTGFTAAGFAVVRLDDVEALEKLRAEFLAVYQPVNAPERIAVERIALAQHALFRIARLEAGLLTCCLNEALDPLGQPFNPLQPELAGDIEVTRAQNRNYALAEGFHRIARQGNTWTLFLRYQAQAERLYRRAAEEFERLKSLRPESPDEPDSPENETNPLPPESAPQPPPVPPGDRGAEPAPSQPETKEPDATSRRRVPSRHPRAPRQPPPAARVLTRLPHGGPAG